LVSESMTDRQRIRVLVADGHTLFRRGLASLLQAEPDFEVVGEAGDSFDVVERTQACRPDVIYMDAHLAGGNGFEAARRIRAICPAVKIVLLADAVTEGELREAVTSGAQGYVLKEAEPEGLCEAIRSVVRGEAAFSRKLMATLVALFRKESESPGSAGDQQPGISPREREVLALIAQGKSNKEIAVALDVAENTAKNHLKTILAKFQLENRVQAAAFALRHGLVFAPAARGVW
jgi:two-component system nitrate/nitrite response regulator NarL